MVIENQKNVANYTIRKHPDMFENNRIMYYVFAVSLILVANYVATQYKQTFINETDNSAELIQKYLLNENPVYNMHKPKLWIHTKYELNSRKWKDFMSRTSNDLNQPYIHYTIQSIIDQNSDDFNICLIDDETFSKLIPDWDADIVNIAEPTKSYLREIGLLRIIHTYGGMIVPNSFLCTKPLINLYKEGISGKKPFVCETVNRTCCLSEHHKKMLFVPSTFFMGCIKGDPTIGLLVDYLKYMLSKRFDITDERNFIGDSTQWCIKAINAGDMNLILGQKIGVKTSKRKTILLEELFEERKLGLDKSCVGIYIPEDELAKRHKYNWFLYLSKEDLMKTNVAIVKYIQGALSKKKDEYIKKIPNDGIIRNVIAI